MRRLLTMSAAKRDLKKALAGASWARCRPNPCGKTNYINLCQINRETHFQRLVCIPYTYFILFIKKKYENIYVGKHSRPTSRLGHDIFYLIYLFIILFIKWQIELREGFSLF